MTWSLYIIITSLHRCQLCQHHAINNCVSNFVVSKYSGVIVLGMVPSSPPPPPPPMGQKYVKKATYSKNTSYEFTLELNSQ